MSENGLIQDVKVLSKKALDVSILLQQGTIHSYLNAHISIQFQLNMIVSISSMI